MMYALLTSLLLAAAPSVVAQSSISITPPPSQNGAAPLSQTLTPSYAGLGIEPTSLYIFTGSNARNNLTYNLLSNLQNYTGVPPHIRIGGNAGDTMLYNSSATGYRFYDNPNSSGNGYSIKTDALYFGPDFWTAMDYLPTGTPITYGLNLAYQGSGWLDAIVEQANASLNSLQNANIVGFEIGNEPDLWNQNGFRPNSDWDAQQYGQEWQQAAQAIYQQVLKPKNIGTNFFEPAATATTATPRGEPFEIKNLLNTGVAFENGAYVAGWNQHDYYYYLDVSPYALTNSILLDLSTTPNQFKAWREQSEQAYNTGKPYYLREMGSVGPEGIQGISDTFANTLWTLNFFLYASTVQVASVQMHYTAFSYGSPWLTIPHQGEQPRVRSSYYAYAALDQIIGAMCNVRIASYTLNNLPQGYANRLGAYHAYSDGNLQSLIAFNTQPANSTDNKNSVNFVYSVPTWAGQTVHISYLTADGADSTDGTTWNGISFDQSGNGTPQTVGKDNTQVVGSDGSLTVAVRDSQAVVVNLGSRIGTANNMRDEGKCQNLATSTSEGNDANPNDPSLAGGGAAAAPTFSSQPDGNNPFYGAAYTTSIPSVVGMTLLTISMGAVVLLTS
ncbi:unnamed protein product [Sympodiomycopsis kandeliae]